MNNDPRNMFVNQRMPNSDTQDNSTTPPQHSQDTQDSNYNDLSVEDKKKVLTDLANKYQREGEGQLVKDIIANVIDQKARGLLTNAQLQEFARRVTPMLNNDQKQRLGSLLEQLIQL